MRRGAFVLFAALFLPALCAAAADAKSGYAQRTEVRAFIAEMVGRHGFREAELRQVFSRAQRMPGVLEAMRPRDATRSWERYRANFLDPRRIDAGLEFWRVHRSSLERAREQYGVPEEVILAILGVETFYGRNMGRWRVIDALSTLAFDYPQRAAYFRSELENYLLFARDNSLDVFSLQGSYAGAIGMPQFMPGSYLKFAVDFDADGAIDLRTSAADSIGSIGNFLVRHGWRRGEPIQSAVSLEGEQFRAYIDGSVLPKNTLAELAAAGVRPRSAPKGAPEGSLAILVELETPERPSEYRLGFQNFWVLTRYNRSALYAAAVADLADALRASQPPK